MEQAWYKQFWPWFLIALPAAAVVASIATFFIAKNSTNDMVVESYYKKGKAINADLSLIQRAKELNISASVRAERDHLVLDIELPENYQNQPLQLKLAHRTLAKYDYAELVTADGSGNYRFGHDLVDNGRWFFTISPADKSWRLQEELNLPLTSPEVIDGK